MLSRCWNERHGMRISPKRSGRANSRMSPSTQRIDRTDKLAVYAEFGVKHCWYVDPIARTLEVLALSNGKWLIAATFKDAEPVTAAPFEVHTFPLDVLWAPD